jgi:hypothetical protein
VLRGPWRPGRCRWLWWHRKHPMGRLQHLPGSGLSIPGWRSCLQLQPFLLRWFWGSVGRAAPALARPRDRRWSAGHRRRRHRGGWRRCPRMGRGCARAPADRPRERTPWRVSSYSLRVAAPFPGLGGKRLRTKLRPGRRAACGCPSTPHPGGRVPRHRVLRHRVTKGGPGRCAVPEEQAAVAAGSWPAPAPSPIGSLTSGAIAAKQQGAIPDRAP